MKMSVKRQFIQELEGLRGGAAVAVLVTHLAQTWWSNQQSWGVFTSLISFGSLAVIVFFFLSGFVIGHTTPKHFSVHNLRCYLLRRILRLGPIFWLAVTFSFWICGWPLVSNAFALHLGFLHSVATPIVPSNGPLWSIHFEVVFYLLFIFIWKWPKLVRWLVICSVIAVLSAVWGLDYIPIRVLGLSIFWIAGFLISRSDKVDMVIKLNCGNEGKFWVSLFLISAHLAILPLNAILSRVGLSGGWLLGFVIHIPLLAQLFLAPLQRSVKTTFVIPSVLVSLSATLIGLGYATLNPHLFVVLGGYGASTILLVMAVVFAVCRFPDPSLSFWRRCAPLGSISFALYVIHQPILDMAMKFNGTSGSGLRTAMLIGCAAVTAFLAAWLLERRFQPQVDRFGKRVFGGWMRYEDAMDQRAEPQCGAVVNRC